MHSRALYIHVDGIVIMTIFSCFYIRRTCRFSSYFGIVSRRFVQLLNETIY